MTRKRTKKRNANDATQRNVRASRKRDEALMARLLELEKRVTLIEERLEAQYAAKLRQFIAREPMFDEPKRRGR